MIVFGIGLILLDEPAAGLSVGELDRLGDLLKEVRGQGIFGTQEAVWRHHE
jgi:ABC-type branched-subunit amino acid transport system ATPase component